jgi:hypothetical protein
VRIREFEANSRFAFAWSEPTSTIGCGNREANSREDDSRKRQVHFSCKLLGQTDPLHCTQRLVLFPQTANASIITVLHHHQQHIATMLSKEAIKSLISDCDEEWLEAFMMFETNKTTAVVTHPSELGRMLGERATPK